MLSSISNFYEQMIVDVKDTTVISADGKAKKAWRILRKM